MRYFSCGGAVRGSRKNLIAGYFIALKALLNDDIICSYVSAVNAICELYLHDNFEISTNPFFPRDVCHTTAYK